MYKKILFILLVLLSFTNSIHSQMLEVVNLKEDSTDLSAITNERRDYNGKICALIKVRIALDSINFGGPIIGPVEHNMSEWKAYMPDGTKKITIYPLGYLPLDVVFEDYGINKIESRHTYTLVIDASYRNQANKLQLVNFSIIPSNASLQIDNLKFSIRDGQFTQALSLGTHTYTVSADYYTSKTRKFTLTESGNSQNINVELSRCTTSLDVSSTPTYATVILNKRGDKKERIIGNTPLTNFHLESGDYIIKLRKKGYKTMVDTVSIKNTDPISIDHQLIQLAKITLKTITGAEIWIDDKLKGVGTIAEDLTFGTHSVKCIKEGYKTSSCVITISNSNKDHEITLPTPEAIVGSLLVNSSPSNAQIYLDGENIGTSPLQKNEILVGNHNLQISYPGYMDINENISIEEGKRLDINKILIDPHYDKDKLYLEAKRLYDSQNYTMAFQKCRISAEMGHAMAQNLLGECYFNGQGVKMSNTEASKWYAEAAKNGCANAYTNIGLIYNDLNNFIEAVKWYRQGAEQGDPWGQYYLGTSYMSGNGIEKSLTEGAKWIEKAARMGIRQAKCVIGICYKNGAGVIKDTSKALMWLKWAADDGDKDAEVYYDNLRRYGW